MSFPLNKMSSFYRVLGLYLGPVLLQLPLLFGLKANTAAFVLGVLVLCVGLLYLAHHHALEEQCLWVLKKKYFLIISVWILSGWVLLAIRDYFSLQYRVYDTGLFLNLLVNWLERGHYYSSVLGFHGFADHFTPSLLLFAPFVKLSSSLLWLTFAKIMAFAISTFLLYQLGQHLLGANSRWVYLTPILWLVNVYYAYTMRWEFQPTSLASPLIIGAFFLAIRKKYGSMVLCLLFLTGFKENLAFIWICVGGHFYFFEDKRRGLVMILAGVVIGLMIYFLIMPLFYQGIGSPLHHQSRFGPLQMIPEKLRFFVLCLLSVGALPLLDFRTLGFILPAFALVWLSDGSSNMLSLKYYYQDMPMTVVFLGVLYGVRALQNGTGWLFKFPLALRQYLYAMITILILTSATVYPQQWLKKLPNPDDYETIQEIRKYTERLDTNQKIWAADAIGIYLLEFPLLKILPRYSGEREDLVFADKSPHVVILTRDAKSSNIPEETYRRLVPLLDQASQDGRYIKKDDFPSLLIYEKVPDKSGKYGSS